MITRWRWIIRFGVGAFIGAFAGGTMWYWYVYHQPSMLACRIEQSIVIHNQTKNDVQPVSLYIKLPLTNERQKVEDLEVTPERYPVTRKANLLTVTCSDPMKSEQRLTVEYAFTLKVRQTDTWRSKNVRPADTEPEPDIESDAPSIVSRAKELCPDNTSKEQMAYAYYTFAAEEIRFKKELAGDFDRSAKGCLESGEGVCGHKANLVTALCRTNGIPARSVSGMMLPRRSKSGYGAIGSHGWNEIYIEGTGWLFADPTYGTSIFRRPRYWGDYDIYHVTVVATGSNPSIFRDEKEHLPSDCIPYCEMTGFPCFLLTFKKGPSLNGIWIRGDEMDTRVIYTSDTW